MNRRHLHHHRNLVCSAHMAPKCGQIIMTSLHGLPAILCNTGGTLYREPEALASSHTRDLQCKHDALIDKSNRQSMDEAVI